MVGWDLKARAGKKKVGLELGGNAARIVDDEPGLDLDAVVERIVFGAYYQSGQSCIGVQRIFAHAGVYERLRRQLKTAVAELVMGDPRKEKTFVGPMRSEERREGKRWVGTLRTRWARR